MCVDWSFNACSPPSSFQFVNMAKFVALRRFHVAGDEWTVALVPADGTPPVAVGLATREQAQRVANVLNVERELASALAKSRGGLRVKLPAHKG